MAQAEIDTSTRSQTGQRSEKPAGSEPFTGQRRCVTRASIAPSPCRMLPCSGRVLRRGHYARSDRLCAMRLARRSLHLREVLHHLQRPAKRAPLHRRSLLLPRLPGSLRSLSGQQPWPLSPEACTCRSTRTHAWPPPPEAWFAISPMSRDSRTMPSLDCNPRSSLPARKLSYI